MTDPAAAAALDSSAVYVLTYDRLGNETRYLLTEVPDEAEDRSRSLGIGATGDMVRIDHGPFVATESELRPVGLSSLAAAVEGNYYGTAIYIDRSAPPVNENILDLDDRYHLDVQDGQVVARVTERYPQEPPGSAADIAAGLQRIVAAYDCTIASVDFTLAGGGTPEEFAHDFSNSGLDPEHAAQLNAEQRAILAGLSHDANITLVADPNETASVLMDAASALADYLSATRSGPLDAAGVLNLLRGGHLNLLIGEKESDYLEVKTAMHPIWVSGTPGDKAKIELAQDVARFANSDVDAVLVIGYRETSGGNNEIGTLTPVADQYLNPTQIREVLDARIVPPLDGLLVETFQVNPTESVLAVYVPKQPSEMQPYLVHGAIAEGKVEGAFFSIVRRRGEASITTSAQQIHAYIVAGKRYLRGQE
ncbi:hypothetical protein [Herbiconiux sp. UC225_62]|uniref:hypothetical protein n=1 Tax=Herbiconiux sp. UC225_62 TaxID=3350168 RepID=UPI0036D3805E